MKKIMKILLVIIVLLFAAILILPVIFKDKIVTTIKEAANENLKAQVDFGEFDLTLIKNFPDFTFEINQVSVKGVEQFENITLLSLDKLITTIDLKSALSGDIQIKTFELHHPVINALVLADSSANWDITYPSEEVETEEESEETDFKMALKYYAINNADITYEDQTMQMKTEIKNLTHTGSGDFTLNNFLLNTMTTIEKITFISEGVKMLNEANINFKCDMEIDMPNSKYTFKENVFSINELQLAFDGYVAMPNETDTKLDITFTTQKTDFKSILSLIPAVYMTDFQNIQTAGNFSLNGMTKGIYNDNQLPQFDIKLAVNDAMFRYPDLPKSVKNIQIQTHIYNPGGNEDQTVVEIPRFHMEMGENPVDITFLLKTPISDPYVKTDIVAQIDLSSIKEFMPLEEGEEYSGNITSDIHLAGHTSAIENEQYDKFSAQGKLIVLDLLYHSPEFNYDTKINNLYMDFTPENIRITSMDMNLGKSDIALTAKMDNLLSYYFDKAPLKGSFQITSELMDVNELMGEDEEETTEDSLTTEEEPFEVPANMEITLKTDIKKMLYDNMEIDNISGTMAISNQVASINRMTMNLMDGSFTMKGTYNTQDIQHPKVDFSYVISDFDIQQSFKTFNTIEKLAPIAENAYGKFSAEMDFITELHPDLTPVYETMSGVGSFSTKNVLIKGSKGMEKLAEALKNEQLKELTLKDVKLNFQIENGKINVDPFDIKIMNSQATVYGYHSFDNTMNYTIDMKVKTKDFGGAANQALNSLMTQFNQKTGAGVAVPEEIDLKISIVGETTNPKIKIGAKDMVQNTTGQIKEEIEEQVKEQVEQKVEEVKEDVKAKAKEEADKIMQEAQEEADKIRKEAKAAAEKVRKEGYAQAQQIEDEATNPLKKAAAKVAADKLRKETDKKADQIIAEGNKKADKVLEEARKKADEVLNQ